MSSLDEPLPLQLKSHSSSLFLSVAARVASLAEILPPHIIAQSAQAREEMKLIALQVEQVPVARPRPPPQRVIYSSITVSTEVQERHFHLQDKNNYIVYYILLYKAKKQNRSLEDRS